MRSKCYVIKMELSHYVWPYYDIINGANIDPNELKDTKSLHVNDLLYYASLMGITLNIPIINDTPSYLVKFMIKCLRKDKDLITMFKNQYPNQIEVDLLNEAKSDEYYDPLTNLLLPSTRAYYSNIFPITSDSRYHYELAYLLYTNKYFDNDWEKKLIELLSTNSYLNIDDLSVFKRKPAKGYQYIDVDYRIVSDDELLFTCVMKEIDRFRQVIKTKGSDKTGNKTGKKATIPKKLREDLWRRYYPGRFVGECQVCRDQFDALSAWHAGHIVSEAKGGSTTLDNLAPVCAECNLGMRTHDMRDWARKYYPDAPILQDELDEDDDIPIGMNDESLDYDSPVRSPKIKQNIRSISSVRSDKYVSSPRSTTKRESPVRSDKYESELLSDNYLSPTRIASPVRSGKYESSIDSDVIYSPTRLVSPNSPVRTSSMNEFISTMRSPSPVDESDFDYDDIDLYQYYIDNGISDIRQIDTSNFSSTRLMLYNVLLRDGLFGQIRRKNKYNLYDDSPWNSYVVEYILGHKDPTVDGALGEFKFNYTDNTPDFILTKRLFPELLKLSNQKIYWVVKYYSLRTPTRYESSIRNDIRRIIKDDVINHKPSDKEIESLIELYNSGITKRYGAFYSNKYKAKTYQQIIDVIMDSESDHEEKSDEEDISPVRTASPVRSGEYVSPVRSPSSKELGKEEEENILEDDIDKYQYYIDNGVGPLKDVDTSNFSPLKLTMFYILISIFGPDYIWTKMDAFGKSNDEVIPYILGYPNPTIEGALDLFSFSYFDHSHNHTITELYPTLLSLCNDKLYYALLYYMNRPSNYQYEQYLFNSIARVASKEILDYKPDNDLANRLKLLPINKYRQNILTYIDEIIARARTVINLRIPISDDVVIDDALFKNLPSKVLKLYQQDPNDYDRILIEVFKSTGNDYKLKDDGYRIIKALYPKCKDKTKIADEYFSHTPSFRIDAIDLSLISKEVSIAYLLFTKGIMFNNYKIIERYIDETSTEDIYRYLEIGLKSLLTMPDSYNYYYNNWDIILYSQNTLNQKLGLNINHFQYLIKLNQIKSTIIGKIYLYASFLIVMENDDNIGNKLLNIFSNILTLRRKDNKSTQPSDEYTEVVYVFKPILKHADYTLIRKDGLTAIQYEKLKED
jgi:hypothetical protein